MANTNLWDFAVAIYGRPGVEDACLSLQDGVGLDVDVLLFCLWLGSSGRNIVPVLDAALAVSEDWQTVIAPLRAARRALKALPTDDNARLRTNVKACELDAERGELQALARLVEDPNPAAVAEVGRVTAEANLKRYFSGLNIAADLLGRDEVLRILNAAFPG